MNLYTFCEYLVDFGDLYQRIKEEGLDVKECVSGIITLFLCYYDQLLKFILQSYDYDKDDKIKISNNYRICSNKN